MKRMADELATGPRGSMSGDDTRIRKAAQKPSGSVLVVDDEAAICELLSLYLSWKGLQVSTAQSAGEAVVRSREKEFDLIILDWDLAGVEALDLLNYFKGTRPGTPVIVFTGKEMDDIFLKKALAGRADGMLRKLGSLDSLWKEVSQQLTKRRDAIEGGSRNEPNGFKDPGGSARK